MSMCRNNPFCPRAMCLGSSDKDLETFDMQWDYHADLAADNWPVFLNGNDAFEERKHLVEVPTKSRKHHDGYLWLKELKPRVKMKVIHLNKSTLIHRGTEVRDEQAKENFSFYHLVAKNS
ncbi:hypothetical protein HELRODRAFT_181491 [Helobdella robusta]|uniref:Uncharacterized protein n=1 Tax=Helobdella robusta TaxID=6412 RepID=T1FH23_HELRO|nr:hypothetical protein HELRODRAFT_181491 [Helobdella robusta]ESN92301.1 hypothetical protein HELRODRAFT_181491 [Helobdella robusta]